MPEVNTIPDIRLIADEPKLQISTLYQYEIRVPKSKDTDKHITTIDLPEIFVISGYILYFCQSCGFHLHIGTLGKVVIFYEITGFFRYNFFQLFSIYRY